MSPTAAGARTWLTEADCDLEVFRSLVEQRTDPADHPSAERVEQNVPLYDSDRLRSLAISPEGRRSVQDELVRALSDGPGIVVLKGAFPDAAVVDAASEAFRALIEEERASGTARGDHFAKPGANDRVWNALDKVAVRAPEVFADYYANDMLELIAEAWLGPAYQVTSQVNVVNPGGVAQNVHRDYHLGFLSQERAATYPAHVHRLSPVLTLQGAVAHCAMPVESGPTLYLPHSQKFEPGYLAWRLPRFVEYFDAHHVQLPWRRATRSSSTRHSSTPPGTTVRRTSGAWPICCRSPPPSAAPWSRWTARRWRTRCSRCCCAVSPRASRRTGCAA